MKELNNYLDSFGSLIRDFRSHGKNNVTLGGSLVLKLHGLNFDRTSGDLDIIVYQITKDQENMLSALDFFRVQDSPYDLSNYKFRKDHRYLNILISNEPRDLAANLTYTYKGLSYPVELISGIIREKAKYARTKDFADFLQLKNSNFNPW